MCCGVLCVCVFVATQALEAAMREGMVEDAAGEGIDDGNGDAHVKGTKHAVPKHRAAFTVGHHEETHGTEKFCVFCVVLCVERKSLQKSVPFKGEGTIFLWFFCSHTDYNRILALFRSRLPGENSGS